MVHRIPSDGKIKRGVGDLEAIEVADHRGHFAATLAEDGAHHHRMREPRGACDDFDTIDSLDIPKTRNAGGNATYATAKVRSNSSECVDHARHEREQTNDLVGVDVDVLFDQCAVALARGLLNQTIVCSIRFGIHK